MNPFVFGKIQSLCRTLDVPLLEFDNKKMNEKYKESVVVLKKIKDKNLRKVMLKSILIGFENVIVRRVRTQTKKTPTDKSKKKRKRVRFYKMTLDINSSLSKTSQDDYYHYRNDENSVYYSSQLYKKEKNIMYIKYNENNIMDMIAPICVLLLQKDLDEKKLNELLSHTIIKIVEIALGGRKFRKQKLEDVCGYENEKNELLKIVKLRLHPEKIREIGLGARNPILTGQPGNGKSMILRALANYAEEHGALVINFSGYMELERWLPIISELTQELNVPVFICIDEIDEIGVARDVERTKIYEFLRLIDGLTDLSNVTFIATTNRPHLIDIALLRPERFSPMYKIGLPNKESREKIITFYIAKHKLKIHAEELKTFIKKTNLWSCVDIRGVIEDIIYLHDGNTDFKIEEILKRIDLVSKSKVEKNEAWNRMLEDWRKKQDFDVNII